MPSGTKDVGCTLFLYVPVASRYPNYGKPTLEKNKSINTCIPIPMRDLQTGILAQTEVEQDVQTLFFLFISSFEHCSNCPCRDL